MAAVLEAVEAAQRAAKVALEAAEAATRSADAAAMALANDMAGKKPPLATPATFADCALAAPLSAPASAAKDPRHGSSTIRLSPSSIELETVDDATTQLSPPPLPRRQRSSQAAVPVQPRGSSSQPVAPLARRQQSLPNMAETPSPHSALRETSTPRRLSLRETSEGSGLSKWAASLPRRQRSTPGTLVVENSGSSKFRGVDDILESPSSKFRPPTALVRRASKIAEQIATTMAPAGSPSPKSRDSSPFPGDRLSENSEASFIRPGRDSSRGAKGREASTNEVREQREQRMRRHRLVRRDAPFHQSSGKIFMDRTAMRNKELNLIGLGDWFHVLLEGRSTYLVLLLITVYTVIIIIFAGIYMGIDGERSACGLAEPGTTLSFHTAFAFSVETMTTIGYGIPHDTEAFFSGCISLTLAVYGQSLTFIILNAALLGIIFARVGRANARAAQIIFSDKAVIRCVRGKFYLNLQVAEASFLDYHPIVEAHVRVYAVLHERMSTTARQPTAGNVADAGNGIALFQTRVLRITNPNDELGGMLFLATPQQISHRIDRWSPLFPPSGYTKHTIAEKVEEKMAATKVVADLAAGRIKRPRPLYAPIFPGLVLREDDVDANEMIEAEIKERENLADEIEEEIQSRRGASRPPRPETPRADAETPCDKPTTPGSSPTQGRFVRPKQGPLASEDDLRHMREEIRRHIIDSELEIIVLVEAIEPSSSNTFQARHSYMASDIEFDSQFAPTMSVKSDGRAHLDWNCFHKTTPVQFNTRAVNSSLS